MTTSASTVTGTDFKAAAENALGTKFIQVVEKTITDVQKSHLDKVEKVEKFISENTKDEALKAKLIASIEQHKANAHADGNAVKLAFARAIVDIVAPIGLPIAVIETKTRKGRGPNKNKAPVAPVNAEHVSKVRGSLSIDSTKAIGTPDIMKATGLSSADIKACIAHLKTEKVLTIVGKGRGTKWHLNSEIQTTATAEAKA